LKTQLGRSSYTPNSLINIVRLKGRPAGGRPDKNCTRTGELVVILDEHAMIEAWPSPVAE
jgi:hypothetical protein